MMTTAGSTSSQIIEVSIWLSRWSQTARSYTNFL